MACTSGINVALSHCLSVSPNARRDIRRPRLTTTARLGPVLVGLLSTYRGDAAG